MNEQLAWEQLPDEPDMWFDRFTRYYLPLLPSVRTLSFAYRLFAKDVVQTSPDKSPCPDLTGSWRDNARKWKWKQRAAAYDEHQRQYFYEHEAELRVKSRKQRIEALELFLKKCIEALQVLPPEKASYASLAQSMKTIARELRAEHGEIDRRTKVELDIMLKELPPDLRQALLTALQADDST